MNGDHIGYIGQSNLVGYVTDANNNLLERFVYNDAGLPVLMYINIGVSWHEYAYVYDGPGQIVGLVDDNSSNGAFGTEVVTYQYDAWENLPGAPWDNTSFGLAKQNPFIYKGYWYDWDTGLYYLNARYYHPTLGQFLSEDPVSPQVGDALCYNERAYVRSNPVALPDPAGTTPSREDPSWDGYPSLPEGPNVWQRMGNALRRLGRLIKGTGKGLKFDLQRFASNIKFPKSNSDIKKVFGVDAKTFHSEIKPDILKQIRNDPNYSKQFNKLGHNPDVGINSDGNVVLKSTRTGQTLGTDPPFDSFLP